jgi:hypothetical protein
MKAKSEYALVFSGKLFEVHQAQSLLQAQHIDSFTKDDMLGQLFPLFGGHGVIESVKLFVRKIDLELAQRILSDYLDNNRGGRAD